MRQKRSERLRYLEELIEEFQSSDNKEARIQVLSNLANFAYDPHNSEHLLRLRFPRLLITLLQQQQQQQQLKLAAVSAVCNLSVHPVAQAQFVSSGIVTTLSECLYDPRCLSETDACQADEPAAIWQQTAVGAIGALFFLLPPRSASSDTCCSVIDSALITAICQRLEVLVKSVEPRLSGGAAVLLKHLRS